MSFFFFLEIDLTSGYITEIVAQRSGDLQIQNFMRSSARLIYAMWPPEAHEFDTPGLEYHSLRNNGLDQEWENVLALGPHSPLKSWPRDSA